MDTPKSVVAEPSSRFLFRDASDRVGELAWDCDCNCDCDRVGELEAEDGGSCLRKTYAKVSNGAASDVFMNKCRGGCDMV